MFILSLFLSSLPPSPPLPQVTIIKNLELYGLDPQAVASILQQKVQASATVTPLPGTKERAQVQIQGNQIHHLAKLLLGKYAG